MVRERVKAAEHLPHTEASVRRVRNARDWDSAFLLLAEDNVRELAVEQLGQEIDDVIQESEAFDLGW